jgi:DNA-binding response OmpR family regulator
VGRYATDQVSDASTQSIPVIALTAHALAAERARALDAGCDDYETKPVDLERLLGKIDAALRGRH